MDKSIEEKIKTIDTHVDSGRILKKDSSTLKVTENVFDDATLKILYNLSNKGIINALGGSISTGKEANVFMAEGKDKKIVALKIYRITNSTFNSMDMYIIGDPRFKNVRHTKKDLVFAWTKKEYRNLLRSHEVGIKVPYPIIAEKNVLVMEFIGHNEKPYPSLKNTKLDRKDACIIFNKIIEYLQKLYLDAKLVHADLSEYNILIEPDKIEPIIIDMGQSVTNEHPRADQFLKRDIENISNFFKKYDTHLDQNDIYSFITKKERL